MAGDVVFVGNLAFAHHAQPGDVPGWEAGRLAYRSEPVLALPKVLS
jgi:hypothetical protein